MHAWPASSPESRDLNSLSIVIVCLVSPVPFLISRYCLFGGYQDGSRNNPTLKSTDLGAGCIESNLDSTDKEVDGREIFAALNIL